MIISIFKKFPDFLKEQKFPDFPWPLFLQIFPNFAVWWEAWWLLSSQVFILSITIINASSLYQTVFLCMVMKVTPIETKP